MKFKIYIINIEKGIKEVTIEDNKRLYDVQGFILLRDKETLIALGEEECIYLICTMIRTAPNTFYYPYTLICIQAPNSHCYII